MAVCKTRLLRHQKYTAEGQMGHLSVGKYTGARTEISLGTGDQLIAFHKPSIAVCFVDCYQKALRKKRVKTYLKPMVSVTISGVMCHVSTGRFFLTEVG